MTTITDEEFLAALAEDFPPEEFESYEGDMFFSQVRSVSDTLRNLMQAQLGDDPDTAITVGFECDSEGSIDGCTVGLAVPGRLSQYLVKYVSVKDLTDDRLATGEASALAIKSALMSTYLTARDFAREKGLI